MGACEEARPFGQEEVVKMSQTSSAETGKPYGVARVCHVWEQARSTFYARQERAKHSREGVKPGRRGPKPLVSDEELLRLIQQDLAASPFRGEGHRKVWGRLHFGNGFRVSRKRVLRLMREDHLLSPHRVRQGEPIVCQWESKSVPVMGKQKCTTPGAAFCFSGALTRQSHLPPMPADC